MQSLTRSRSEALRAAAALLVMVLVLAPGHVLASAPVAGDAEARARQHFAEGTVAYDLGEFQKALQAYTEAYRLAARPGLLFNVAQCHRQLGQHERAAFFYRRFLYLAGPDAPDAELARELLAEVEARAVRKGPRYASTTSDAPVKAAAQPARPPAPLEPPRAREVKAVPAREPERTPAPAPEQRTARAPAAAVARAPVLDAQPVGMLPAPMAPAPAVRPGGEPLTRKWWLWAGVGAAAVLAGGIVYAATAPDPRPTTLGNVPGR